MTYERTLSVEEISMSKGTQQDKQHIQNLNQVFYGAPNAFSQWLVSKEYTVHTHNR